LTKVLLHIQKILYQDYQEFMDLHAHLHLFVEMISGWPLNNREFYKYC